MAAAPRAMVDHVFHRGQLSRRERQALQLMRGAGLPIADADGRAVFARFADQLRRAGYTLNRAESPYVSNEERLLLGWLALLQRQRADHELTTTQLPASGFVETLRDCASLLDRTGCRLDYRNVQRAWCRGGAVERTTTAAPARGGAPVGTSGERTLQARVSRFVAESGPVTTLQLCSFGASRQVVSMMYKKGLLQRVRHGLYAAG